MSITQTAAGAETCRSAFGAVLTQQGRGFYVGLELLAILWGVNAMNLPILSAADPVRYRRRSHDFARRIMAGDALEMEEERYVRGDDTKSILRALLESLRVPIPNRRVMPKWLGQHLYPYLGELIHYDAAPRVNRISSIERYTYRGGGGLAHKILRSDPDPIRHEANRFGLLRLVEDSGGPLGQLARACSSHDWAKDGDSGFIDDMEKLAVVHDTPWVEHLRNGVRNVTGRDVVNAKKVELLMLWVPYCIARHQLDRATQQLGREPLVLPASLVPRNSPMRQFARRELGHARSMIDEALHREAAKLAETSAAEDARVYRSLASKRGWSSPYVGFFVQSLATSGAVNAHIGMRHLTIQLPLLETLVCATLSPGVEMKLEEMCEQLLVRYGILAGPRAPAGDGPFSRIDAADLSENSEQLARDLEGLGLLTSYSDATRMVHGEVA